MSRLTSQRRTILSTLFLIVTILAWTIGAWGQAAGQPVTNATVIRMVTDKLPEATIITRIQSGPDRFDLSPDGLVALSKAGVSKNILRAMMASNNQPAQSSTPSTPGGSGAISGAGNNPTPRNTATGTKRIPNVSAVKLTLGPKIKIAGGTQPSVSPTVSQTLQQQSLQTRAEKTATPVGGAGGTNPTGGSGMLMSAGTPAGGTSPGTNPTGGTGGIQVQRAGVAPVRVIPPGAAAPPKTLGQKTAMPVSGCNLTVSPTITSVSGKTRGIVFTPDPGSNSAAPNNQYSIRGCNFGPRPGEVHLVGAFINHPSPLRLGIDSWTDNLIIATVSSTIQDEYDLTNITLAVVTANGPQAQMPGQTFLAARESRHLLRVPRSVVTLPTTALLKDVFVSPVDQTNLLAAKLTAPSGSATLIFFQYATLWDSPTSDGYPQARVSWGEFIDVSKMRPGFVLDTDVQTLIIGNPSLGWGSCKFFDVPIGASMQGNKLGIGVQPEECDEDGKFIYAYYGLNLSVTGPKGSKLDPWPSNL